MLLEQGLTVRDFHDITMGMAINLICARVKMIKERNGENVSDPEQQYQLLKASEQEIDELYYKGQISIEKYRRFKMSLKQWEDIE